MFGWNSSKQPQINSCNNWREEDWQTDLIIFQTGRAGFSWDFFDNKILKAFLNVHRVWGSNHQEEPKHNPERFLQEQQQPADFQGKNRDKGRLPVGPHRPPEQVEISGSLDRFRAAVIQHHFQILQGLDQQVELLHRLHQFTGRHLPGPQPGGHQQCVISAVFADGDNYSVWPRNLEIEWRDQGGQQRLSWKGRITQIPCCQCALTFYQNRTSSLHQQW